MAKILKGKVVASKIKEDMIERIEKLKKENKTPRLAMIRLGENPGDISYEKSIVKNCDELGIDTKGIEEKEDISTENLIEIIERENKDKKTSGILIFRPLPDHIDDEKIKNSISPEKDVDCMNPLNLEKIFEGDISGFVPGTPQGAIEILEHYDIDLKGKNVLVINRSMVVGKPLSMMLLEKDATVTIAHSKTKNLKSFTNASDVVVTAIGKANILGKEYFNEDSIIIDVGVSRSEGKIRGDSDYDNLKDLVKMITPVPGGVGSVTTSIMLNQVVKACEKQ